VHNRLAPRRRLETIFRILPEHGHSYDRHHVPVSDTYRTNTRARRVSDTPRCIRFIFDDGHTTDMPWVHEGYTVDVRTEKPKRKTKKKIRRKVKVKRKHAFIGIRGRKRRSERIHWGGIQGFFPLQNCCSSHTLGSSLMDV